LLKGAIKIANISKAFLSFICPLFVIVLFFAKAKNKTKNLLLKGSNKADFDINLISKI
jgi:hypothetical protein